MIDGPVEIEDLERTAENKETVRRFLDEVLIGGTVQQDHRLHFNRTI